jgi:hypothetical protein
VVIDSYVRHSRVCRSDDAAAKRETTRPLAFVRCAALFLCPSIIYGALMTLNQHVVLLPARLGSVRSVGEGVGRCVETNRRTVNYSTTTAVVVVVVGVVVALEGHNDALDCSCIQLDN